MKIICFSENSRKIPPHPNIVLFRGICQEPLCIIVDFCDGGSLLSLLRSDKEIDDKAKMKYVTEIARGSKKFKRKKCLKLKGMIHLHTRLEEELIHRDL